MSVPETIHQDPASTPDRGLVLFTAFEPSGDAHAAPVIESLRRRRPDLRICAWGGPRMAEAGAEIIERTSEDGVMGLGGFLKAFEMKRTLDRIDAWAGIHPVALHVPVDSPSANFPLCRRLRRRGTRTIHLIAPKVWAWGQWRVRKLVRHSDHVLCILPFEESWFQKRGVDASFIGHPVMAKALDEGTIAEGVRRLPNGSPRILILPGSRSGEIKANLSHQLQAFGVIRGRFPGAVAVILAANEGISARIRTRFDAMPDGVDLHRGNLESAIAWADLALATSGTVSLDLARQDCPMIGSYAIPRWQAVIASMLIKTPFKLLPNIVAGEEIVPEFVPYVASRGPELILASALPLLAEPEKLESMRRRLTDMKALFGGFDPGEEGARRILALLDSWRGGRPGKPGMASLF
jgi:lipid-A-disaccharide synthase